MLFCDHCNQFIITGKNDQEIKEKIDHIKNVLINMDRVKDKKDRGEELSTLTKVLVGLSSLSTEHPDSSISWRQIQGSDKDHVSLSAGWTKSQSYIEPKDMTFRKILHQPHNIYKLLYYNVEQQHILSNKLRLVILKADFGAGK